MRAVITVTIQLTFAIGSILGKAENLKFCVVDNFGNIGSCFSTLSMCSSWAANSIASSCVAKWSQQAQKPALDSAVDNRSALSRPEKERSLSSGNANRAAEDAVANQALDKNSTERIAVTINEACREGSRTSLSLAMSFAEARRKAMSYLEGETGAARKSKAREVTEKMNDQFQKHLEFTEKIDQRRRAAQLKMISSLSQEQRSSDAIDVMILRGTIESYVMAKSAQLGWETGSVNESDLESVLVGDCLATMR